MKTTFEQIAGYEVEKAELMRLCEMINRRDEILERGARLPKGVVFYGPTGTGKTMFARALAETCDFDTYAIDLANMDDAHAINRSIRKAFQKARKSRTCSMIIFDEMDKFVPNLESDYISNREQSVLSQLLTLIDGLNQSGEIIFVATCNSYSSLPPALVRPGRIDKKFYLGYPDQDSREQILLKYAEQTGCQIGLTLQSAANLSAGLSCAALETLVNECALAFSEDEEVSEEFFRNKILEIKNERLPSKVSLFSRKVLACEMLGHFLVAQSLYVDHFILNCEAYNVGNDYFNRLVNELSDDYYIVTNGPVFDEDGEDSEDDENDDENDYSADSVYSKQNYLDAICVIMGGIVAQEMLLKETYGFTEKLDLIDDILILMAGNGQLGLEYYFNSDHHECIHYSTEHCEKLHKLFAQIMQEQYERAKALLEEKFPALEELVPVLAEREVITEAELIAMYGNDEQEETEKEESAE